jgi:hypothetical protein
VDEHLGGLALVGVEFSDGSFVEEKPEQSAEVAGAEPSLVFKQEGVKVEFVAGEDVGDQVRVIANHRKLLLLKGLPAIVAKRMGGSYTRVGEPEQKEPGRSEDLPRTAAMTRYGGN